MKDFKLCIKQVVLFFVLYLPISFLVEAFINYLFKFCNWQTREFLKYIFAFKPVFIIYCVMYVMDYVFNNIIKFIPALIFSTYIFLYCVVILRISFLSNGFYSWDFIRDALTSLIYIIICKDILYQSKHNTVHEIPPPDPEYMISQIEYWIYTSELDLKREDIDNESKKIIISKIKHWQKEIEKIKEDLQKEE